MSDTYSYEVLEPGGHARLVGNVLDRISRASANPASAVGSSRAVLGDAETASWMERTTAADGAALIESVKGNTLRWNQLVQQPKSYESRTTGNLTVTSNEDGSYTVNGTTESSVFLSGLLDYSMKRATGELPAGHKYLIAAFGDIAAFSQLGIEAVAFATGNKNYVFLNNESKRTASNFQAFIIAGTYTNAKFYPQIFDLTAMFGAGNEPATVAEFEAMFPDAYYPYDPGSLLPVRMTGVETVAADESWSSQRTIPAATYFPDGMRSAGTVRDELRADAAVTRVGERSYQSGDESDASVITDGTVTHYALATPTTTTIDPPLLMSYRTGAGGTERVMVASGTTSAPPMFATRYPLDPADLAASIAPVDGPIAKTNHQVGDLLMLGFTLCKVTQVIVTGETIAIGTNVTKTTVAAELAALSE